MSEALEELAARLESLANDKDTLPRMDSERVEIRAGEARTIAAVLRAAAQAEAALAGAAFCKTDVRYDSAGNPVLMPHDVECRACRQAEALAALRAARGGA